MIVSPGSMYFANSCTVPSVGPPAGTMTQAARGLVSFCTKSCRLAAPTAFLATYFCTASALRS